MFYWRRKVEGTKKEVDQLTFSADMLFERLQRIAAEHTPIPGPTPEPPTPPTPVLLLPAPDYRREYIGRYDWGRKTIFPFDG